MHNVTGGCLLTCNMLGVTQPGPQQTRLRRMQCTMH